MTALHSMAVLRPSTSVRSDIRLAEWNSHSSPTPLVGRPVRLDNNKAVSVGPCAPQPAPPMPSIRLRTCETCGFLPRRLLRSASSLPAAGASGHSGSTTRTLLRNPQDSRAVLRTTAVFAPRTINHSRNCQAQVISPSFGL